VWLRDLSASQDDQDYEWPACILISAACQADALQWGNCLAESFCKRNSNNIFLNSSIEMNDSKNLSNVPKINFGEEASDEEIGW
jgi:hypothetical protein